MTNTRIIKATVQIDANNGSTVTASIGSSTIATALANGGIVRRIWEVRRDENGQPYSVELPEATAP